ncbi:Thioesterase/thiol ester dehydrase-isomerase [Durotheca rogersii]|uniref:Thioesterase/thiol ester dehydrase-isomerase n=1 Tax=Durotheca rogersii TaxID=419775 RepID=UPI00221F0418|nr:Thioesterase/thiol ester dehydrase-isomerase [Durotheca rogersii]KAI5862665.1 Thioesterase/thiol ester dehydrase-isomerase [Durotheca rogersii]
MVPRMPMPSQVLRAGARWRQLPSYPGINMRLPLRPGRPLSACLASSTSSSPAARDPSTTYSPPKPLPQPHQHQKPSLKRRAATVLVIGIVCTSIGFAMSIAPAIPTIKGVLNPPTDEETLAMFVPEHDQEREVEEFIDNHPLTRELRSRAEFSESRPHLKIPQPFRGYNLTGGTLMGPGRVVVPPVTFAERGGRSLVSISYIGDELCGHPGIVHGGFLATMLDEGLARCCFAALPHKVGLTANLSINYRAPAQAGSYVVLRAKTTKVEGRKAWVEGRIETLVGEGEQPVVLAEATALFVSPKQAAVSSDYPPLPAFYVSPTWSSRPTHPPEPTYAVAYQRVGTC